MFPCRLSILNDEKYPVAFEYAGQDTATVEIAANNGEAIENELLYGSVSGKKVDEIGEALGGALIGLFKTDGDEFTKENALMTTVSEKDGSFSFADIPYGTWYVREIEQPTGFVLNDTVYDVVIDEDEKVVEIEIVNEFITVSNPSRKPEKQYKFKEEHTMEKFITDERTGLQYELVGDYYLVAGEDEPEGKPIGVWGQRHLRYLKQHRKVLYSELLISGKLNDYLADINEQAEEMFSRLVKQLAEKEGVTEALKAENQMLWVQKMNNIRNAAIEVVSNDLIYA